MIKVFSKFKFTEKTILLIILFFVLLYRLLICFNYKIELVNGETNNVWNAINVANGKRIYSNPEQLPLEVFQYTPLSQLPIILMSKFFDDKSVFFIHNVFTFGRIFVLIFNVIGYYFLYKTSRILTINKFISYASAILGFSILTHITFAIRPDALLLCALFFNVFCFIKGYFENNFKLIYLSCFLIAFSTLIKQDAFIVMAPLMFFLMLLRKWKVFLISGITFIFSLIIIYGVSYFIFGQYFLYSILKGLQNPIQISNMIYVFDRANSFFGLHFIFGIAVIMYNLIYRNKIHSILIISLLTLFYLILGVLSTLKVGSGFSYYTPYISFSSILIIEFLYSFFNNDRKKIKITFLIGVSACLFITRQIYIYTSPFIRFDKSKNEYLTKINEANLIKDLLKLRASDHIVVVDQYHKLQLSQNSVLINQEYYGVSKFDYSNFKAQINKRIKYFIYDPKQSSTIENLNSTFKLNIDKYKDLKMIELNEVVILEK